MLDRLKRYRQIGELEQAAPRSLYAKRNDREKRSALPIAVVDDEAFKPEPSLRALGYDITVLGDLRRFEDIVPYNIILCDLQGVGRYIDSKGQGAFIIDEIKRNHPEKFVIAYTGGSLDDAITLRAQEVADSFIRKDADIDEWRDKLDSIVHFLSNPIEVWKRQRLALVEADVDTLDILRLEDAFTISILQNNDWCYRNAIQGISTNPDLRAIAQSLVASGIFRVLVG